MVLPPLPQSINGHEEENPQQWKQQHVKVCNDGGCSQRSSPDDKHRGEAADSRYSGPYSSYLEQLVFHRLTLYGTPEVDCTPNARLKALPVDRMLIRHENVLLELSNSFNC